MLLSDSGINARVFFQNAVSTNVSRHHRRQYRLHPSWSYQLHHDNLAVCVQEKPELGPMPSYNTILRYMKTNGLCKRRVIKQRQTAGAMMTWSN